MYSSVKRYKNEILTHSYASYPWPLHILLTDAWHIAYQSVLTQFNPRWPSVISCYETLPKTLPWELKCTVFVLLLLLAITTEPYIYPHLIRESCYLLISNVCVGTVDALAGVGDLHRACASGFRRHIDFSPSVSEDNNDWIQEICVCRSLSLRNSQVLWTMSDSIIHLRHVDLQAVEERHQ